MSVKPKHPNDRDSHRVEVHLGQNSREYERSIVVLSEDVKVLPHSGHFMEGQIIAVYSIMTSFRCKSNTAMFCPNIFPLWTR